MLPQDQHPPYACHQYRVHICRKGKWRTLAAKAEAKDRLGGGGKKNSKYNKGGRKTPLSLFSRVNEEDTPLGSVLL